MVTRIQGSPQQIQAEIAKAIAERSSALGPHARAILILESAELPPGPAAESEFARLMTEAHDDAVSVGNVDDSREAIYTRMDGE